MKKIDKLILINFLRPFFILYLVVTFILVMQFMLKYFDELVGKDLSILVFAELYAYFGINMTPISLPLTILLTSLMCYGSLGEHSEFTALKASGVSVSRIFRPILVLVLLMGSGVHFMSNSYVPNINKKAFSLLHDIRAKKAAFQLVPGQFFYGLPQHTIRIEERLSENVVRGVLIYDHSRDRAGLIVADSCYMYNILEENYMVMHLFNGYYYSEQIESVQPMRENTFARTQFGQMRMVFDLSSFRLRRSDEEIFAHHRYMKTIKELQRTIDSLNGVLLRKGEEAYRGARTLYTYHSPIFWGAADAFWLPVHPPRPFLEALAHKEAFVQVASLSTAPPSDSVKWRRTQNFFREQARRVNEAIAQQKKEQQERNLLLAPQTPSNKPKSPSTLTNRVLRTALSNSQQAQSHFAYYARSIAEKAEDIRKDEVEIHKRRALAFSCIVMFLIGAPLGTIVRRGGLGIPFILSLSFFIVFYVIMNTCHKLAQEDKMNTILASWFADMVLLPVGVMFWIGAATGKQIKWG